MKLSDILGWEKKEELFTHPFDTFANEGYNTALTSCDREIDREALANIIFSCVHPDVVDVTEITNKVISTMPTWLRKVSEK